MQVVLMSAEPPPLKRMMQWLKSIGSRVERSWCMMATAMKWVSAGECTSSTSHSL
jgi:hypothetical protein